MRTWVSTYHSKTGGWNGSLGFVTKEAAAEYAEQYKQQYPGSRAEIQTDEEYGRYCRYCHGAHDPQNCHTVTGE